jgi:AraC-like DNA-binding protein
MYRNRRVRHSYPPAVVALAYRLFSYCDVKAVAKILGIRSSTLYRWRCLPKYGLADARQMPTSDLPISTLIEACEASGFSVQGAAVYECLSNVAGNTRLVAPRTKAVAEVNHAVGSVEKPESPTPHRVTIEKTAEPKLEVDFAGPRSKPSRKVLNRLYMAQKTLTEKFNTHIGCRELAAVAEMTKYNFITSYRKAFGESPYRSLLRLRVNLAMTFLRCTKERTDVIAMAVGFDSYATMGKAFKRFLGMTVHEYCKRIPDLNSTTALRQIASFDRKR